MKYTIKYKDGTNHQVDWHLIGLINCFLLFIYCLKKKKSVKKVGLYTFMKARYLKKARELNKLSNFYKSLSCFVGLIKATRNVLQHKKEDI